MKDPTKRVFKLHGWRVDRAVHNYLYFLFYDIYVRAALILIKVVAAVLSWFEPMKYVGKFIFERYHAKVLSREDVTKIINLNETVMMGPDTSIVPYKYANKIILREPGQLAVMDCPCKKELKDPCQPLASCIAVGQPLVDFWMDHCKRLNVRRITPDEAMEIIDAHRKTGHVNQAFFKVATGGSMGVICNCCPKCCVSIRATRLVHKIKGAQEVSQYAPSGYLVEHDEAKCRLSGRCADVCNFGAIEIVDGKRVYHPEACMGCGLCVENCEQEALTLVLGKGPILPLDIDAVRERVAE